jgi:hypothetical protein
VQGREIYYFSIFQVCKLNVQQLNSINSKLGAEALSAVLFLYHEVLKHGSGLPLDAVREKQLRYLPKVLKKEEVLSAIA